MKKKKVFFVHGYGLSSPLETNDWPSRLGREIEKYGFEFIRLSMPDPMYPDVKEWIKFLDDQNIKVDKNTYFVGHSLGCVTIARYLEKLPKRCVAGGCVFVAGFSSFPEIPLLHDFCFLPLDFSKVREHSQDFTVVISDNDMVIPRNLSEEFAKKLGAKMVVEHKKGHFVSGIKEIPSILNIILEREQMGEELKEIKRLKKNFKK